MKKVIFNGVLIFFIGVLAMGFEPKNTALHQVKSLFSDDSTYIKEIETWHQMRIEGLKSENGWLNLAGLFWLEEGKNTFGSAKTNKIVFPKGASAMGHFTLKNGEVSIEIDPKAKVLVKNAPISTLKVFPSEEDIVLESGSLRWFIIKRGDKYGIRLRDLESETLLHFTDIETFPIDSKWRVKATLERAEFGKTVDITDVLGQTTPQASPGTVVFNINGKEYRLDAVDSGKQLFLIFADETSGKETYGAGRFLYANKPDANGNMYLDFNKAVNPPCAFTAFATCPLPPKQNRLSVAITAGEKNYGEH